MEGVGGGIDHFNSHFSRCTWVSQYENVSILDYIGANGDGDAMGAIRRAKLQSNRHHQQTINLLKAVYLFGVCCWH